MIRNTMKIRNGFVSNSSSSSFVIDKIHLTDVQIELIYNHIHNAQKMHQIDPVKYSYHSDEYDAWNITESENQIIGYTNMDNFDIFHYLNAIGVDSKYIKKNHYLFMNTQEPIEIIQSSEVGPSSFNISKDVLSQRQIDKINDHIKRAQKYESKDKYKDFDFGYAEDEYAWKIVETDTEISGSTDNDYFDMYQFLMAINVDARYITWIGN